MPIEFFDSHNHLDFSYFDSERRQLVDNCRARGIVKQLISGVKPVSWVNQLNIARQHHLFAALGFHPCFLQHFEQNDFRLLESLLQQDQNNTSPCVIAIGECGLDFWNPEANQKLQLDVFQQQIALAQQYKLPLVLHCRKAWDQMTHQMVKQDFQYGGIAHAFAGSLQQANKLLDLGFKLGFGGAITHPRAKKLRRTLQQLPDDAIVLETDAPDMKPAFIGGKANNPIFLPEIAAVIAAIRQQPLEELAESCMRNTCNAFNLPR